MSIEIELKFQIRPHDLAFFRQLTLLNKFSNEEPQIYQLKSYYFDTPDLDLLKQGFGLRIRPVKKTFEQTIKSTTSQNQGALHQRQEWTHIISSFAPDLSVLPDSVVNPKFLDKKMTEQMVPLFVTDFTRTAWLLSPKPEVQIECSLDIGVICCGNKQESICEVEFELFQGTTVDLWGLAEQFQEQIFLVPEELNKAEKGFNLVLQNKS
jgi:triphosphatase